MNEGLTRLVAPLSEATVVELARAGDLDAFQELVRRRQDSVRILLRRLCRDVAQAEDLSQDVFIQAWRGIGALQSNGAFWSWLRQIAIRTWMRSQKRSRETVVELDDGEVFATGEPRYSDKLDLDKALIQLQPAVRLCIVLSYQAGMSHSEISAVAGLPIGTVKSHIVRGTKALRESLVAYKKRGE